MTAEIAVRGTCVVAGIAEMLHGLFAGLAI